MFSLALDTSSLQYVILDTVLAAPVSSITSQRHACEVGFDTRLRSRPPVVQVRRVIRSSTINHRHLIARALSLHPTSRYESRRLLPSRQLLSSQRRREGPSIEAYSEAKADHPNHGE